MEIQVFENSKFGEVRSITDKDGKYWFIAKDIAEALGYSNPSRSVQDHCKYVKILKTTKSVPLEIPSRGLQIIPESDVYRLIMRSNLTSAVDFQDWVVEEVLPAIRKQGEYRLYEKATRRVLGSEYLPMGIALTEHRQELGKTTSSFHYSNEADMINVIVTGLKAKDYKQYYGVKEVRDNLLPIEKEAMIALQRSNTVFIDQGYEYQERKQMLIKLYNRKWSNKILMESAKLLA